MQRQTKDDRVEEVADEEAVDHTSGWSWRLWNKCFLKEDEQTRVTGLGVLRLETRWQNGDVVSEAVC